MKHNVRRAQFGVAWLDRLGHLSASFDGEVETYGAGWAEWPVPCPTCVQLVGHRRLFAWCSTIRHRHQHYVKPVMDLRKHPDWTGPDVPLMDYWTPEPT